jgi:folate-binding protein YgfZ
MNTDSSGRLLHLGALRFTGPDSSSFLQGQVSTDTRRLAENQCLLAAYSSPQGRVLAIMHLLPHSSGIIALLPRELVLPTLEALRKFVLRAKVKIEDAGDSIAVAGLYGADRLTRAVIGVPQSSGGYTESDGIGIAEVNRDPGRYWAIGAAEKLAEHGLAGDIREADRYEQAWRLADIRAGIPQIYLPTRAAFVAQMLNLDRLGGISFSKGCYTGQEIIARTQHLGRIKRRLYRLELPRGAWRIGQPLRLSDGRTGRLVEVIETLDGFEALAVLNVQAESVDGGETSAGAVVNAVPLSLPYEL